MRKGIQIFLACQMLFLSLSFVAIPRSGQSQTKSDLVAKDTLNIGYAAYTKGKTPGTLDAIWNYANVWSGKGKATGVSKGEFAGNYHIKYYYEDGSFSDEYDLVIENLGKFYQLTWNVNGKALARGVGTVLDHRLVVGWRRVAD